MILLTWIQTKKMRIWPYLIPEASNLKNKGTFFSSTLKVEEKKVPLFFGFKASGLIYSHFVIYTKWVGRKKKSKSSFLGHKSKNEKHQSLKNIIFKRLMFFVF